MYIHSVHWPFFRYNLITECMKKVLNVGYCVESFMPCESDVYFYIMRYPPSIYAVNKLKVLQPATALLHMNSFIGVRQALIMWGGG